MLARFDHQNRHKLAEYEGIGDGIADSATVLATFGITADHLELLVQLASAYWHRRHEDVASALDHLRTPAAVDALYHLA